MKHGNMMRTCRWKLSKRSALSSTVALVLRSGGREPGKLSSSWIRCAIRACNLRNMVEEEEEDGQTVNKKQLPCKDHVIKDCMLLYKITLHSYQPKGSIV